MMPLETQNNAKVSSARRIGSNCTCPPPGNADQLPHAPPAVSCVLFHTTLPSLAKQVRRPSEYWNPRTCLNVPPKLCHPVQGPLKAVCVLIQTGVSLPTPNMTKRPSGMRNGAACVTPVPANACQPVHAPRGATWLFTHT